MSTKLDAGQKLKAMDMRAAFYQAYREARANGRIGYATLRNPRARMAAGETLIARLTNDELALARRRLRDDRMNKTRGGSRDKGRILSNNTSGLNAIWFRRRYGTIYVCTAVGEKRPEFSVRANGRAGACYRALDARQQAGLPVRSLPKTLRALGRFEREGA